MSKVTISEVTLRWFEIPTDRPESDGTLEWTHTGVVTVQVKAGETTGFGLTYAGFSTARLIQEKFVSLLQGQDPMAIPELHAKLGQSIRNIGRDGVAATAISAVDLALWDLKGKLLGISLAALLGAARDQVPIYGSGGFTSYSTGELQEQLGGWAAAGIQWVKMKVGREPDRDPERVRAARSAIGAGTGLFVDANGAYDVRQAVTLGEKFNDDARIVWFEEPVSSDDLAGMRFVRDHLPAPVQVAAGEYGYDLDYFRRFLEVDAVDVLQADITRCGGVSGFMAIAGLAEAFHKPLSSHCAPALHVAVGCAAPTFRHVEYFHDHVRIERMLFANAPEPVGGSLVPAWDEPGLGLHPQLKAIELHEKSF
ncbi:MAG: mandelate racemase [Verrucomicrobia bacterium]|nr:mandelate racemase [Verrucomicrobiota bacterium]